MYHISSCSDITDLKKYNVCVRANCIGHHGNRNLQHCVNYEKREIEVCLAIGVSEDGAIGELYNGRLSVRVGSKREQRAWGGGGVTVGGCGEEVEERRRRGGGEA